MVRSPQNSISHPPAPIRARPIMTPFIQLVRCMKGALKMSPIIIAPVVIADMVATTKMEVTSRLHNEKLSNVTKPYSLRLPIKNRQLTR